MAIVNERLPYGNEIGDRLWMWGHHCDSFAALQHKKTEGYNLPYDKRIDMADACKAMSIPGCFVVRWLNLPRKEDVPSYMTQFKQTKRVGFSITDGAAESFDEKVEIGLALADKMPNLTRFVMDDYWSGVVRQDSDKLLQVRDQLHQRGMKLCVVLYSDANDVKPEYKETLDICDEVTFWFWHGKNVAGIEERVAVLRALIGDTKPILLGQYMYDFGGKKLLPGESMALQLEQTSRLLAAKAISGVIFHCTPLVDMDLDAVKISRQWIRENAAKPWGK